MSRLLPTPDGVHPVNVGPPASLKARVTVVEHVYHQLPDEQPLEIEARFSRYLDSDEQLYTRRLKLSTEWELLDTGWVHKPSTIVLRNEEGKFTQVKPTDEERAEATKHVVEVRVGDEGEAQWYVPCGESFRGSPSRPVYVRSRVPHTRATIWAIP